MNIHVHIERLVVDGMDIGPSGAIDLQGALQNRLTQLLSEHGLPSGFSKTNSIATAEPQALAITRRTDGSTLGGRVAEALHAGFQSHSARPEEHGSTSGAQ